jgi:hypothetical protein
MVGDVARITDGRYRRVRVDGGLLHAGLRRRLVVARTVERALGIGALDLEPLAGAGLLRDRPQRLERGGLLLDLERRRVTAPRQRIERLVADQPREPRATGLDLGDVRLLCGQTRLGLLA